jgi:signal transduction histidine kinase
MRLSISVILISTLYLLDSYACAQVFQVPDDRTHVIRSVYQTECQTAIGQVNQSTDYEKNLQSALTLRQSALNNQDSVCYGLALYKVASALRGLGQYQASLDSALLATRILSDATHPVQRAACWYLIGSGYFNLGNKHKALPYLEKVLTYKQLIRREDPVLLIKTFTNLGNLHIRQNQIRQAEIHLLEAEQIDRQQDKHIWHLYHLLYNLHQRNGRFHKAIEAAIFSYEIADSSEDSSYKALSLNAVAAMALQLGEYEKAATFLNDVLCWCESGKIPAYACNEAKLRMASALTEVGRTEAAQPFLTEARHAYRLDTTILISIYSIKSIDNLKQKKFDAALLQIDSAIHLANTKTPGSIFLSGYMHQKAAILYESGQEVAAKKMLTAAIALAQQQGAYSYLPDMLAFYRQMDSLQNNLPPALDSQAITKILLEDSLYQAKSRALLCMEQFQGKLSIERIELNKINQIKQFARQNKLTSAVLMTTTVILIILLWVLNRKKNRRLRNRLQTVQRDKDEQIENLRTFNYSVSHDLKSPINNALDQLSLLNVQKEDDSDKKHINIEHIRDELNFGLQMIDALKQYAEVQNISLGYSEIETNNLLEKVIKQLAPSNKIQISIGELPNLWGDAFLIRQVFVNLLDNAIKFSQYEKIPHIAISGIARTDGVEILIADNGVGIPAKYQQNIFKPFHRAHTHTQFPGTGLGLAIVKKILERHTGTIQLTDNEPHGCRVQLFFPAKPGIPDN